MPRTDRSPGVGQRDVDRLLDQDARVALLLELDLTTLERLAHRAAGLPDPLARLGLGLGRQRADLAVGQGQRAAVARVREPDLLERVEVGRGSDSGERLDDRGVDVLLAQHRGNRPQAPSPTRPRSSAAYDERERVMAEL